jgi:hypothetical protein
MEFPFVIKLLYALIEKLNSMLLDAIGILILWGISWFVRDACLGLFCFPRGIGRGKSVSSEPELDGVAWM